MLVVGLGGFSETRSCGSAALEAVLEGARRMGARTETIDVRRLDLPAFAPGAPATESVTDLVLTVERAAGVVWANPERDPAADGSLRNALEWIEAVRPGLLAERASSNVGAPCGSDLALDKCELNERRLRVVGRDVALSAIRLRHPGERLSKKRSEPQDNADFPMY
jgi:NAD(P)H-dependent FMN reductase